MKKGKLISRIIWGIAITVILFVSGCGGSGNTPATFNPPPQTIDILSPSQTPAASPLTGTDMPTGSRLIDENFYFKGR
jgi:hypothetical protein